MPFSNIYTAPFIGGDTIVNLKVHLNYQLLISQAIEFRHEFIGTTFEAFRIVGRSAAVNRSEIDKRNDRVEKFAGLATVVRAASLDSALKTRLNWDVRSGQ